MSKPLTPVSRMSYFQSGSLIFLFLIYAYFCYLMVEISMQYIPIHSDVAFLRIKQDVVHLPYYLPAFFIHAFTALLVLPAGFTQFSKRIRVKYPAFHRWNGWIYAVSVLFLAGPTGFIIGIHANGGWSSQLAFCLLGVLWIWFTWKSIIEIRRRNFQSHRAFMIRSFALAMSAITLRAWKYILVALFHPRPMDLYRWVAWLGWVVNLIIAEIIILNLKKRNR